MLATWPTRRTGGRGVRSRTCPDVPAQMVLQGWSIGIAMQSGLRTLGQTRYVSVYKPVNNRWCLSLNFQFQWFAFCSAREHPAVGFARKGGRYAVEDTHIGHSDRSCGRIWPRLVASRIHRSSGRYCDLFSGKLCPIFREGTALNFKLRHDRCSTACRHQAQGLFTGLYTETYRVYPRGSQPGLHCYPDHPCRTICAAGRFPPLGPLRIDGNIRGGKPAYR
jgi:hypothetical protein